MDEETKKEIADLRSQVTELKTNLGDFQLKYPLDDESRRIIEDVVSDAILDIVWDDYYYFSKFFEERFMSVSFRPMRVREIKEKIDAKEKCIECSKSNRKEYNLEGFLPGKHQNDREFLTASKVIKFLIKNLELKKLDPKKVEEDLPDAENFDDEYDFMNNEGFFTPT